MAEFDAKLTGETGYHAPLPEHCEITLSRSCEEETGRLLKEEG
jgi:hypothetical protein